ncbi:MAG: hypothetical protein ACJ74E_02700, partial [Actinomycetes bacterium]
MVDTHSPVKIEACHAGTMRILVADALEASAVQSLEAAGHSCQVTPDLTADSLPNEIGDFEALI